MTAPVFNGFGALDKNGYTASLSPGLPTYSAGDKLLALVLADANRAINTPSGWDVATGAPYSYTTTLTLYVYERTATASESAPTFALGTGNEGMIAGICSWSNLDSLAITFDQNNATSMSAPAAGNAPADSHILRLCGVRDGNDNSLVTPSTQIINEGVGDANEVWLGISEETALQDSPIAAAGFTIDTAFPSVLATIVASSTAVNQAPVFDTPIPDQSIIAGATGSYNAGAHVTDPEGDTVTYSISPNIELVTGFTFNDSTGVISHNGNQVAAGSIDYTVTADDGQGNTTSDTFSLVVTVPALAINSVSTVTPTANDQITIGFINNLAPITASCSAGSLVEVSQSGNQAIYEVPNPPTFGDQTLNFESDVVITISDGTNTDTATIQIQVETGDLFAQITEVDVDGDYANDAGLEDGDYAHFKDISGDIVIDPATGLVSVNPSSNAAYSYAIYDVTDNTWSDNYAVNSRTAETVNPVITLNGANPLIWVQNVAWLDPTATVTDNVDATRTINADNLPIVGTVGAYTLNYNATDAAGNIADTVTREVTVVAADTAPDQFAFVDVNNAELNTLYENIQQVTGVDAGQTVTAQGGEVSNDNGSTWSTSVQMVTGQTLVKASITTTGTNSLEHSQIVFVNGVMDTFSVTTQALVTRTFTIGSSDPVVDQDGANVDYTYPIWELWDKIPEDPTAIVVDSGVNFAIANGIGSISTSSTAAGVTYFLIARDPGNDPANYIRTAGQTS